MKDKLTKFLRWAFFNAVIGGMVYAGIVYQNPIVWVGMEVTCGYCRSVIELEKEDKVQDYRELSNCHIDCPICDHLISIERPLHKAPGKVMFIEVDPMPEQPKSLFERLFS